MSAKTSQTAITISPEFQLGSLAERWNAIELYNINNGERFSTYIIKAQRGSGAISLNGAAARKAHVGDPLIICTYGMIDEKELNHHQPKIVLVSENNQIKSIKKVI